MAQSNSYYDVKNERNNLCRVQKKNLILHYVIHNTEMRSLKYNIDK